MRTLRTFSFSIVSVLAGLAMGGGCGTDDDRPTPRAYPRDAIDDVKTTETLSLPGLVDPVRVVRDTRGMVHVYGRNLHDTAMAQGFMTARDRAPQLELLRRVAEGRLAEYAGKLQPDLVDRDLTMRAMGLRRTAVKYYATLKEGSDAKAIVDGYAAGVSHYFQMIRDHQASVPNGWLSIRPEKYTAWDPAASLAIARLQTWALSYTGDDEIDFTELYTKLHATFTEDSTDAAIKARASMALDVMRFEPAAKRPVIDPPKAGGSFRDLTSPPKAGTPALFDDELLKPYRATIAATKATREMLGKGGWSSNNWVVSASKSATGKAMVASDPHLGLPAPAIFHMVGFHVIGETPDKNLDVSGMAFAGIPGVVLGFNKNIAWGATVAVFDVNDLYRDKIVDGKVKIGGVDVAVEAIEEQIDYGDGRKVPITIEAIPGHGVVLPTVVDHAYVKRTGSDVVAVRWTGMEPSGEFEAFMALAKATNVDEAVAAMAPFQVGAQNFVFGDSAGNIRYTTHARVPTRPPGATAWNGAKFTGQVPCLAFPGDAGLEWNGNLDDAKLPAAKNPAVGYIATANSDQYGLTFDNDPTNDSIYLSCVWDLGFREARVRERLDAKDKISAEDMASIQADAKSPLGARIAKYFVATIDRAEKARLGTSPAPDLDALIKDPRYIPARMQFVRGLLDAWGTESDYEAASGVGMNGDPAPTDREVRASQATLVFNATMIPLYGRVFDDEWTAMGKPAWMKELQTKGLLRLLEKPEPLATADSTGESVLWDDMSTREIVETKDERILGSILAALDFLTKKLGDDPDKWRWGMLHTIRFSSLLSGTGGQLSIPSDGDTKWPEGGYPRHGDDANVDRCDFGLGGSSHKFEFSYSSGPAQRMVALLDPAGPVVMNALPGGNVWIPSDKHFADEVELWRLNKSKKVAFSPGEVVLTAESRLDLLPF